MHGENRYNSINIDLVTLQPGTVTSIKIYTHLFSGWFAIGQIDTRKSFESINTPYCIVFYCMVNHVHTERCPVALRTFKYTVHNVIQEVRLCNFYTQETHSHTNTKYAIPDFNPSLDHLWWYRATESTHLWTLAIRNYCLLEIAIWRAPPIVE